MSGAWQELAAYAVVVLAASWLAFRWHRRRRTRSACDRCPAVDAPPRGRLHLPVIERR